MNIADKRVLVTGGSGFLGRHIVEAFDKEGAETTVLRSRAYDLTEPAQVLQAFRREGAVLGVELHKIKAGHRHQLNYRGRREGEGEPVRLFP